MNRIELVKHQMTVPEFLNAVRELRKTKPFHAYQAAWRALVSSQYADEAQERLSIAASILRDKCRPYPGINYYDVAIIARALTNKEPVLITHTNGERHTFTA